MPANFYRVSEKKWPACLISFANVFVFISQHSLLPTSLAKPLLGKIKGSVSKPVDFPVDDD